ncbi:unnamed protein product [Brassica oleracea var. botrytis]|nr:unnamed protein product [Brassica oleracea]
MTMLPDNLVEEEILSRVPATSLKRLRSTCKLWNGIFNDRRFAKNHFDKAAKQSMVLKLTKEYRLCSFRGDELGLIDPLYSAEFKISHVFHCDGLLVCTSENRRIVVWNPCTGQTKWITHSNNRDMYYVTYTLGRCYQNNNYSYKLLRHMPSSSNEKRTFEICEINSYLWRRIPHDFILQFDHSSVYLKGKTYWCASDSAQYGAVLYLLSFDYTTERFARMCLPDPNCSYQTVSLSVVREEKLAVLLRPRPRPRPRPCDRHGKKIEIWISSAIDDETKVVSWSKIFALEDRPRLGSCYHTSFLVDEEKKIAICRERRTCGKSYVLLQYIVGEDNQVTQLDFALSSCLHRNSQLLFNYVPSLVQIQ